MRIALLSVVAVLYGAISSVQAHHSFAMFDAKKERTLTGTVQKFRYTNPHGMMDLEVTTKSGNTQVWSVEFGSVTVMRGQGLSRDTFKPGDKVTAVVNPLRNGTTGGSFVWGKTADGKCLIAPQDAPKHPIDCK
ncbi:MAG: DUF6152 family protein [Steroidobacteraceae bacterium]